MGTRNNLPVLYDQLMTKLRKTTIRVQKLGGKFYRLVSVKAIYLIADTALVMILLVNL